LDQSKLALIGTATAVLNEIVAEHDVVAPDDLGKLHNVVKELGEVVRGIHPDADAIVGKTLEGIAKALAK
jgi:nucleoside-triphosphatase THEP1